MNATSTGNAAVDDALIRFLAERDVPCPGCGYNLRGLKLDTCPECGTKFSLGLHGHMPGFRGWLGAIIMTCVGMGFSLLLVAGGIVEFVLWGFFEWVEFVVFGFFGIQLIAGGAFMIVVVRRRRHFWQHSERHLSWHMVVGGLLLLVPIVLLILLMLVVF